MLGQSEEPRPGSQFAILPSLAGGSGDLMCCVDFESVLPSVIGHRGAVSCAPENTLAGLRHAKALGCRWVEFDVRLTADGQPVLLHDDQLERTTGRRGKASALSLTALRNHDAGRRFDARFAGEPIPTLAEAVAVLAELGLGANVELKARRGREAETGRVVAGFLAQSWPSSPAALLISSFHRAALAAARERAPRIARGILFPAVPKHWRAVTERFGCATVHADHRLLRSAIAAEIRGAGYPLLAYTVNDPRRAEALFDWGITSVFSDVPQVLLDAAARRGSRQPLMADRNSAGIPRRGFVW